MNLPQQPVIRSHSPADRAEVAVLQQLLWQGGSEGNARYLHWKYFTNPYLDGRYLLHAFADQKLVGMIGAFGACWEIPGAGRVLLPCLADTVIAPSHRGTPLFRQMLDRLIERLADDGVPWLLDFGDQPAGPAMLMRGWKPIGPWAVASTGLRTAHAVAPARQKDGPAHNGPRSGRSFDCRMSIDTRAAAELIGRVEPRDKIRHVRDKTYLDWRFNNPLARYHFLSTGDDPLLGYLVGHRASMDDPLDETPTTITDCEAEDDGIWADLIEAALALLPGREVLMWARDLPASRLSLLGKLGLTIQAPTGRLTADVNLPNLLICPTGAVETSRPAIGLDRAERWDLRSTCGRSWR